MNYFKKLVSAVVVFAMVFCLAPSTAFAAISDTADDITYTVKSDAELDFEEDDFNEVCEDATGEELDYVKFTLPSSSYGVLYYKYDSSGEEKVSASKKYRYSSSPKLSDVTFIPKDSYTGTVTIKYTGCDVDGNTYSGKVKVTVKEGSSSDVITYSVDSSDDYVVFSRKDFSNACDDIQGEDLDYVKFTLPDKNDGILYYDYDEDEDSNTKVSSSKKYYYKETPYIAKVAFVPDEDFSGTVTIKYTGSDINGESYTAKIKITVGDDEDSSSDDTITYKLKNNNDTITFEEEDFNEVCEELNDEELDYVKFTIPSATKGVLYYNYSNGDYSSIVSSSKKYYYDSSPYISKITFVPNKNFSGTCKIEFTGYDTNGDSFYGTVVISTGSSSMSLANSVTYSGKQNTAVFFKDDDFNNVCKSLTGSQLSYVTFTLPSDSSGTLYYGYTSDGNYSSKVKSTTKYYYGGSPYILNVAFVPARNVSGTVTVQYTGYDKNDTSYTGKVQITFSAAGTTTPDYSNLVSSKYFSDVDISYSWAVPYIDSLYESGIVSGSSSGSTKLYSPGAQITRGDFMLILHRALNLQTNSTTSNFADVPSGSYYYTAIITAKALGIAQGSENRFYPNNTISREDAMVLVLRAVNITGKTISSGDTTNLSSFSDNGSISDYSRSAVAALVKAGIITGSDDNKIYPQGSLTRAQVAAIIYRVKNM